MGGPSAADAGSDINLYGANPFGGLHQPVPVSSGESDQTYNIGARTEYGMLQQNQKNNPMETQGSKFIAVQDSSQQDNASIGFGQPHASPVI